FASRASPRRWPRWRPGSRPPQRTRRRPESSARTRRSSAQKRVPTSRLVFPYLIASGVSTDNRLYWCARTRSAARGGLLAYLDLQGIVRLIQLRHQQRAIEPSGALAIRVGIVGERHVMPIHTHRADTPASTADFIVQRHGLAEQRQPHA